MTHTYASVETALLAVLGVPSARVGPIRARLKHLNLLEFPGLKSGKGARAAYTFENISQWTIAMLIEQTGVDPIVVARLIKATWNNGISDLCRLAASEESAENPVYLKLRPRLMTAPWVQSPVATINGFRQNDDENILERELIRAARERDWISIRNLTEDFRVLLASLDGGDEK